MARPTALIVNDEPSQLRLLSAVLEKGGVQTRCCHSADEALRSLVEQPKVDIIVTDLHMPGIDGWRFCQILRSPEYAAFNATPILVVSATFSGRDAEQMSTDVGADAFLAAPYAPSMLQEYVTMLLEGRRPQSTSLVLIVEPDETEAQRLRQPLARHGYSVQVAGTGLDALVRVKERNPEVAIIGDPPPDCTTERLLEEFKRPGSRTVVFVVTGNPTAERTLHMTRHGADGCLSRCVDPLHLIDLCEKVCRQRSLMRVEELLEQRLRALRDSESRWRSLLEAFPEIVLVHDEDGVILHINQVGAQRLEWPAPDLIGRSLSDFAQSTSDADRRSLGRTITVEPRRYETTYVSRSGQRVEVEVNERRMLFEDKPAILCVARDITARKELARQRANFLAMLTHDIKNPLAVVLGFTDLLEDTGELNEVQKDLVARMQANAQTVLALVANYLNLTQIEAGNLFLTKKPVPIDELLNRVIEQYVVEAQRQNITLERHFKRPLSWVEGDAVALERVFTNLLHNAIKFTPESGRVHISAERDGNAIIVRVADTGIGISALDLPTIFHPYRRGADRQPREGTGLGLFIAQTLVQAHGGSIDVESTPSKGTCFSVRLPIASAGD